MVVECAMRKCVRGNNPKLFYENGRGQKSPSYSITIYYLDIVADPIKCHFKKYSSLDFLLYTNNIDSDTVLNTKNRHFKKQMCGSSKKRV